MNRRRFLGFAASGGIGTTAGCISSDEDSYATLQGLHLINPLSDPVTAEIRIERDDTDEVAYLESHEITTDPDMITLNCAWPDAPLMVLVRNVNADEWSDLATSDEEGCLDVVAEVREHRVSFYAHNTECPIRDANCHTDVTE